MHALKSFTLSFALAVILVACGGGSQAPGSLQATILGLPAGSDAGVSLSGPGLSTTIKTSQTLDKLSPGSYRVSAAEVSAGGLTYKATLSGSSVTVESGKTAVLNVTYAPPVGSTASSTFDSATGGTVILGPATLTVPPNAFTTGGTVTVTLKDLGLPKSTDPADPLKYVSNAFVVSANSGTPSIASNVRLNPQVPLSLSIAPSGNALTDAQDLIVAQSNPQDLSTVSLHLDDTAKASDSPVQTFRAVKYKYDQLDTSQWVVAVPILAPKPIEKEILQVPYYYQSGIPWCAPTSLAAMLRYYSFSENVFDAYNTTLGPSLGLANWQLAQLQGQGRDAGGGWPLDQVGLKGKYTIYLWDDDFVVTTKGAKGGFNDFLVYTTLVNIGVFGLADRRPIVMIVDNWWHSVVVVGVDGSGLYLHDSNGSIAGYLKWPDFQNAARGWRTDANNKQVFVKTILTGVLHDVPVKPETGRRGSIVLARKAIGFDTRGSTAYLEWDGASPHNYGYYFDDGDAVNKGLLLGALAIPGKSFAYDFTIANVTNTALTYSTVVEILDNNGNPGGYSKTSTVSVNPYSQSGLVQDALVLPNLNGGGMMRIKLLQGGVLQDVKYLRFSTPLNLP